MLLNKKSTLTSEASIRAGSQQDKDNDVLMTKFKGYKLSSVSDIIKASRPIIKPYFVSIGFTFMLLTP